MQRHFLGFAALSALVLNLGPAAAATTWPVEVRDEAGLVASMQIAYEAPTTITSLQRHCFLADMGEVRAVPLWNLPDGSAVQVDGCSAAGDDVSLRRLTIALGPTGASASLTAWAEIAGSMTDDQKTAFLASMSQIRRFSLPGTLQANVRIVITISRDDTISLYQE